jgi:hypothetical protein
MFQMTVMWNFSSRSTQDYLYTLKYTKVEGGIVSLPDHHVLKVCESGGKGLHVLEHWL